MPPTFQLDTHESERRYVTVLFADISGFMAISGQLDPEEVTGFINGCFERLESVVIAHGGVVDRYIGDCLVAVFGLAPSGEDPASHAVRAAIEMRETLYEFNRDAQPPTPLDVHIGINSGPVIAAFVGGGAQRAFTVIGDTVDVASYLEHASQKGQIFVGPETWRGTQAEFDYRALTPVHVEGVAEPIQPFELMAVKPSRRVKRDSERRQATVLFADVIGFRALAEQMEPEALTHLINECLATLAEAVMERGGVIDKYIGECVMALFGVPNAIENAPQQALNAAIEIRNRVAAFVAQRQPSVPLDVRIGVNTGLVIAGEIGGRVKRTFTVMGDTVNIAARLKEAAKPGAIYVGVDAHRYTRDHFEFAALPPLTVKGKDQPIQAYALHSVTSRLHRTAAGRPDRAVYSALVGREHELATLCGAMRDVAGGRGGILSVSGEAGIGKSRLVMEALRATQDVDATFLKARSVSLGHGLSFHPFIDMLERWAEIAEDEAAPRSETLLRAALAKLFGPDELSEIFPFIAALVGIRMTGEPAERLAGMDGDARERLITRSVRELFERLASARPLVVLFEDLHWADQSSIKLLEALLRLSVTQPIVFLLVHRPDHADTANRILTVARTEYPARHVELQLGPLTEVQCGQLIDNLLQIEDLPHSTRALITRKAEGNPFYVEEVVRSLIEQGAVEFRDGRMRVTEKNDSVMIPGTIQEVIMARVDRLDEPTRSLLQIGSVIGRSFYYRLLSAIMEGDPQAHAQLDAELAILKDRQLLFERRSRQTSSVRRRTLAEELEYVFQNALVQETIYESLLQKTRRALHVRVAETIESVFADRLADFYGMLAYHYGRAEVIEKAEEYLFKAGDEAARAAASSEALTFFREASRLYGVLHGDGGDPRKKAVLEKNVALALLNTGNLTESIEHFDRAIEHLGQRVYKSRAAATAAFVANLAMVLSQLYLGLGRRRTIKDWDRERLVCEILFNRARAEITSDPTRLFFDSIAALRRFNEIDAHQIDQASAIYASGAGMFCYSGFSFAVSRRTLAIAKRYIRPGNVKDVFTCATMEFIQHYLEGDWSDAYLIDEGLVDGGLRHGSLWDANTYLGLLCDRLLRQGRFAAAHMLLEKLGELNDAYGFAFAGVNRDGTTALLLVEQRDLDAALPIIEAYQAARHEDPLRVIGLATRAKVETLMGKLDRALETLSMVEKITRRSHEIPPWHLSAFAAARLRVAAELLARGDREPSLGKQAKRSIRYALRIASKVALQRTEIYQLAGCVAWLQGDQRTALGYWKQAIELGTRLQALPELARTFAEAARYLADQPNATLSGLNAEGCATRANELFAQVGLAEVASPRPAVRAA
jgi:class 3 adenylate cyclase/tetratricopeptide (TPR) repeat protein